MPSGMPMKQKKTNPATQTRAFTPWPERTQYVSPTLAPIPTSAPASARSRPTPNLMNAYPRPTERLASGAAARTVLSPPSSVVLPPAVHG